MLLLFTKRLPFSNSFIAQFNRVIFSLCQAIFEFLLSLPSTRCAMETWSFVSDNINRDTKSVNRQLHYTLASSLMKSEPEYHYYFPESNYWQKSLPIWNTGDYILRLQPVSNSVPLCYTESLSILFIHNSNCFLYFVALG